MGGALQIDYGDLTKAQTRLEQALALAKTEDQAWCKYCGLNSLGDIEERRGNLDGALKSYNDGLAFAERLAKSDPANAGWQRDLAVSFGKLALVHKQSGDNAKALDLLRQGQAIMARLTKLSPDNAEWKKDLAEFDQQIAELAPRKGLSQTPARNRSPHPEEQAKPASRRTRAPPP